MVLDGKWFWNGILLVQKELPETRPGFPCLMEFNAPHLWSANQHPTPAPTSLS